MTVGRETVRRNSNVRTRQRLLDSGNRTAVPSPSPQMCFTDLPVGLFLLKNKTRVSTSAEKQRVCETSTMPLTYPNYRNAWLQMYGDGKRTDSGW